jgi:hypothetical protein
MSQEVQQEVNKKEQNRKMLQKEEKKILCVCSE